jgi:hypothetical protein
MNMRFLEKHVDAKNRNYICLHEGPGGAARRPQPRPRKVPVSNRNSTETCNKTKQKRQPLNKKQALMPNKLHAVGALFVIGVLYTLLDAHLSQIVPSHANGGRTIGAVTQSSFGRFVCGFFFVIQPCCVDWWRHRRLHIRNS